MVEMGKSIDKVMKKAAPEIFRSKAALLTTTDRYYPLFKYNYDDRFLCSKLTTVPLPSGPVRSANFVSQRSPYRDHFNRKYKSFVLKHKYTIVQVFGFVLVNIVVN